MALTSRTDRPRAHPVIYLTLAVAIVALVIGVVSLFRQSGSAGPAGQETALARVHRTGVLRVAYGGFPPYTIVDPNQTDPNKRVSGFTVDMINEIAKRSTPALKVEWYNLNWDTFRADMLSGKFDVVADAVYATVPKAQDFNFTEPFSYFGLAAAVVKIDDTRFRTFADLNQPGINIALAQGYVSTDYAQAELSRPTFKIIPVGKDAFSQLDEVLLGHADVALNDIPTVVQYVRAHSTKVKALWVANPPSWAAASFVTRREDGDLANMLSTDIRILKADGTLARLDRKWKSLGYFDAPTYRPGAGLDQPATR
jgi:ABC-type amino acid transport substrate-binding protein